MGRTYRPHGASWMEWLVDEGQVEGAEFGNTTSFIACYIGSQKHGHGGFTLIDFGCGDRHGICNATRKAWDRYREVCRLFDAD